MLYYPTSTVKTKTISQDNSHIPTFHTTSNTLFFR
uniref:Uncharacterized protein n=1 Tax=Anguilla anguilla TaxID=7936 RepID=A0A0E9UQA4_ANGAN